jgi:cellulose synthase/poly-beta-1,6-N-acetylglucosamine synthase-like glycosyltransferase
VPEVSVIVPAHNAEATLGRTLDALRGQRGGVDFEVIVVDDGSTDRTGAIAEDAGVRVLRTGTARGAASARNAGVGEARGSLLAFTDADCQPADDWLSCGAKAARHADLVQGSVLPDPGAEATMFDRTLRIEHETGLFETANLLVSRSWFDSVGGFRSFVSGNAGSRGRRGLRPDPGDRPQGEDTLFGWRLRRLGGSTVFAPDVRVFHEVFPRRPADFIREHWRLRHFPALVAEVPELRGGMPARIFQTRRRVAFDAAAAGALAAVTLRRSAPLLATLPYLAKYLPIRHLPRPWAIREAAALVAADSLGGLALVVGSLAAGELVL